MAIKFLFLPFKGKFDFVLIPEAGTPTTDSFLLLETGDFILLEDGSKLILE